MNKLILYTILLLSTISCRKFVEIGAPKNQLVTESVFTNDASAKSAMDGVYIQMMSNTSIASCYPTIVCGLSADEMTNYSTSANYQQFYTNSLAINNSLVAGLWNNAYQYIYDANAILEGLQKGQGVSQTLKQELSGEAKFVRAFCYFYLTNFFGKVPLILTTDYRMNAVMPRTSQDSIYNQIINDLVDAKNLLAANYSYSGGERTRPNSYTAAALLARVYLYRNDWANAEQQATTVINNLPSYKLVNDLDSTFLKNSLETIWQLAPVRPNENTVEATQLLITIQPSIATLTESLVNSFKPTDKRRAWLDSVIVDNIKYYFPYKYKIGGGTNQVTEYYTVLRLAEQYLIRAEARAERNNIVGNGSAVADLNVIRHRAGLPDYDGGADQTSVLAAIFNERRIELFAEWGHRWFDLKRTNTADAILGSKPNWQATNVLFPVPQTERANNPNLTQNPGYQDQNTN